MSKIDETQMKRRTKLCSVIISAVLYYSYLTNIIYHIATKTKYGNTELMVINIINFNIICIRLLLLIGSSLLQLSYVHMPDDFVLGMFYVIIYLVDDDKNFVDKIILKIFICICIGSNISTIAIMIYFYYKISLINNSVITPSNINDQSCNIEIYGIDQIGDDEGEDEERFPILDGTLLR